MCYGLIYLDINKYLFFDIIFSGICLVVVFNFLILTRLLDVRAYLEI